MAHSPVRDRRPPLLKTAPVADSQRSLTRCSKQALAGDSQRWRSRRYRDLRVPLRPVCVSERAFESTNVTIENPQPTTEPGMAEHAIHTATDVSRSIGEVAGALKSAIDRLSDAIDRAKQPGKPLAIVSAVTREAPLASLFIAFLLGVAVARRR
jgi:hypothetical protein